VIKQLLLKKNSCVFAGGCFTGYTMTDVVAGGNCQFTVLAIMGLQLGRLKQLQWTLGLE
jgi:hypothetical protein